MKNELIGRKALIESFRAMNNTGTDCLPINVVIEIIEEALAVDAVPVVRCRKCKEYKLDCGYCDYWETSRREDDYCSRGAKMDGGAEDEN